MSGDDESTDGILGEIREIVAEGEGKSMVREPKKIGFLTGVFMVTPFMALALIWERKLEGWLRPASEVDDSAFMALLIFFIFVERYFRQPSKRGDWSVLLTVLFLAPVACTTTFVLVGWLIIAIAPGLHHFVSTAIGTFSGYGALVAVLWIASRLTRDRNLILPKESAPDAREGDAL